MEFGKLFELFIAAALINNFVFTRYLGLCIFFGVTKKMDTSIGMSITFHVCHGHKAPRSTGLFINLS